MKQKLYDQHVLQPQQISSPPTSAQNHRRHRPFTIGWWNQVLSGYVEQSTTCVFTPAPEHRAPWNTGDAHPHRAAGLGASGERRLPPSQESVLFLQAAGVDFPRHAVEGIDPQQLAWKLLSKREYGEREGVW